MNIDAAKQTIHKEIDISDILTNDSAEKAIDDLDAFIMNLKQNDGAQDMGIRVTMSLDDGPEAVLHYKRIETDEEFALRIADAERYARAATKRKETMARRLALKQGLSKTSISLTGNKMLKTTPDQILFLEESEAQKILDRQDPGHTIKVFQGGRIARVYTKDGEEVVKFQVLTEANPK